jgi:hypothetical protein
LIGSGVMIKFYCSRVAFSASPRYRYRVTASAHKCIEARRNRPPHDPPIKSKLTYSLLNFSLARCQLFTSFTHRRKNKKNVNVVLFFVIHTRDETQAQHVYEEKINFFARGLPFLISDPCCPRFYRWLQLRDFTFINKFVCLSRSLPLRVRSVVRQRERLLRPKLFLQSNKQFISRVFEWWCCLIHLILVMKNEIFFIVRKILIS